MKPNEEQPTNGAEEEAAALAEEMIAFVSEQFHEADTAERRGLVLQYGPVLKQLHKASRTARRRLRPHRYVPGLIEKKAV